MFDVGFSELLVIALVALLVIGPEQLPGVMLKFGRFVGGIKRQLQGWQHDLESAALDEEIRERNRRITEQSQKEDKPHDDA